MKFIKTMYRTLSDVAWKIGFERLSLKFLLLSLETENTIKPQIDLQNNVKPIDPEYVCKKETIIDSQPRKYASPKNKYDIN